MVTNLTLFIIGLIIFCQILMLIYYFRNKPQKIDDNEIEEKNWATMHEAIKKSQEIVGEAELAGIKEKAQMEIAAQKAQKEEIMQTKANLEDVTALMKGETVRAGEQFKVFLNDLREKSAVFLEESSEKTTKEFADKLEKNLHEIQDGFAKDLALYKKTRQQAFDQNAEEVIARATELYIGKKLSRNEHMQLVFESLERAKKEVGI